MTMIFGPYRIRGYLRSRMPWLLIALFPKGKNCGGGNHSQYRQDNETVACYFCKQTFPRKDDRWWCSDGDGFETLAHASDHCYHTGAKIIGYGNSREVFREDNE